MSVTSAQRLKRLRELLAKLERLPESPERERMLREVRARVVDVDTGETPRAMLAADGAAEPASEPPRRVAGAPAPRAVPAAQRGRVPVEPPPGRVEPAAGRPLPPGVADLAPQFPVDELLSLDESAAVLPGRDGRGEPAPWTRGLRG
jgi:hypothetical protein